MPKLSKKGAFCGLFDPSTAVFASYVILGMRMLVGVLPLLGFCQNLRIANRDTRTGTNYGHRAKRRAAARRVGSPAVLKVDVTCVVWPEGWVLGK